MLLRKTFRFEASHLLPKHPGKCSRLHGHSWVLHVETEGSINPATGFVMDYADMSAVVKPLVDQLDHRHLGAWCVYLKDRVPSNGDSELVERYSDALLVEIWGEFPNSAYFTDWHVQGLPLDFYPSSENLLYWIGEQLAKVQFRWTKVALEETCTSYAELGLAEFMVYYSNKYGLAASQFALEDWLKK